MTDKTLTESEKEFAHRIAKAYDFEIVYDLEGKTGVVFSNSIFPVAFHRSIERKGWKVTEVRCKNDRMECIVKPSRLAGSGEGLKIVE